MSLERNQENNTLHNSHKNNIKYLGVTLTKQGIYLYDKNFKSLKKEIGEDIRRWENLLCSVGVGAVFYSC